MAKKTPAKPIARISYASCTMLCSYETNCPLCGVRVKPMETHTCGPADPVAGAVVGTILKALPGAVRATTQTPAGETGRKRPKR